MPDTPTIVHAFVETARRVPDRAAIIAGGRSITYREYHAAVAGFAHRLATVGVAGGRVALLMPNGIELAVAAMAGMAARAQVAPLNSNYPAMALAPLLADVDATVLVCTAQTEQLARTVADEVGVGRVEVLGPGGLEIDEWVDDPEPALPEPLPGPDDPSLIFFTGGTTGVPKGAHHVHTNDMAHARAANTVWPLERDADVVLMVAPNFHIWGFCYAVVSPTYLGATLDYLPEYKPGTILRHIEEHDVTVFAGGPAALYVGLMANERFATTDFSSLRLCLAGGSPCPEALLTRWEAETGCPIMEGWGMSEGAPINCNPIDGPRKPGSVGPVLPRTEIDIVDIETGTRVLPQGEAGEVRVRGPQFISGYRNRPEDNARTFRDGWLHTGDVGRFDEDGYLYLIDRKKEMILVGGYNVYPREIDEVLASHPAVMEAAAVGIPDDFRGETVKACVALDPGADVGEAELLAWCSERLVKYKLPTVFEFHDELPKTGPGKIDKLRLKGKR
ncbi:MAG: AMP-binding protein [Actinomycetota bacterium]|nr:AMP-binding protein [Actinomycetota bacterium]